MQHPPLISNRNPPKNPISGFCRSAAEALQHKWLADPNASAGHQIPQQVVQQARRASVVAQVDDETQAKLVKARDKAADWLVSQVESGAWTEPSPIGFYFAKLWYYEKLYPMIATVAALSSYRRLAGKP